MTNNESQDRDENVKIVERNKWGGDKKRMRKISLKSKAHETLLAKHNYTLKGPNPGVEMISKVIEKKRL